MRLARIMKAGRSALGKTIEIDHENIKLDELARRLAKPASDGQYSEGASNWKTSRSRSEIPEATI
jgi:hypothetical protein